MADSKRKKGDDDTFLTESSSDEDMRAPESKRPRRPFSVSQIGQSRSSAAPAKSQSQSQSQSQSRSQAKPPVVTPAARQSSKANSKPSIPSTSHDTPGLGVGSGSRSKSATVIGDPIAGSSSLPGSPVASTHQQVNKPQTSSSDDEQPRTNTTVVSRPRVQFECDLNAIRDKLENMEDRMEKRFKLLEGGQARNEQFQALTKKQQDSMDGKLDSILGMAGGGTLGSSTSAPSTSREEKPKLGKANPPPNLAHREMALSIQGRRAHDKAAEGIPSEHLARAQTFARDVMKSMLKLAKVTAGVPEFYYKDGEPDFFPIELTDKNGYCMPCPHWNLAFVANYIWFSTYIERFRVSVPEDGSAFAAACKQFTDRQILVLLHDGPFSSLVGGWKREHPEEKSKGEHKGASTTDKKAYHRGVSRLDAKAFARYSHRGEILTMSSANWNAAWSKLTMSPEVTDEEGGIVVKRPSWRGTWWTNALTTMDGADRQAALAKAGVHRPPPKRTVEYVDDPPQPIYIGTGKDRKIAKYPLVLFSKRWRKKPANAAWMKSSAHLIDSTMTERPDISAFTDAHPRSVEPSKEDFRAEEDYEGGDEGEGEDIGCEHEGEGAGAGRGMEEAGAEGTGSAGAHIEHDGGFENQELVPNGGAGQLVVDDDEEDDLYAPNPAPAPAPLSHTQASARPEPKGLQAEDNSLIDPQLLQEPSGVPPMPRPQPRLVTSTTSLPAMTPIIQTHSAVSSTPAQTLQDATWESHDRVPHAPQEPDPTTTIDLPDREPLPYDPAQPKPTPMPVPPTLSQQERDAAAIVAASAPEPPAKKKKRQPTAHTKSKIVEQSTPSASTSTGPMTANPTEGPVKRGRGRPKGVRNKATIERERLAAEAAGQRERE